MGRGAPGEAVEGAVAELDVAAERLAGLLQAPRHMNIPPSESHAFVEPYCIQYGLMIADFGLSGAILYVSALEADAGRTDRRPHTPVDRRLGRGG